MIEVKNLTKRYGKITALDNISFTVDTGEVLGFLGPNGAGKSTTMNIITGYISSTSGTVTVDGSEILEEPKKTKQKIGYLPEIPPLYIDMTVRKYLEFMFDLKRVKLPKKEHLDEVMRLVGLEQHGERLIKNLSKGYRQRVGFAQALLGNPPVIILDEPTVGYLRPHHHYRRRKNHCRRQNRRAVGRADRQASAAADRRGQRGGYTKRAEEDSGRAKGQKDR